MNEMAMRIVNALRVECGERACTACPCDDWCSGREVNCLDNDAADLIESLSAQLDQVTRERDAAEINKFQYEIGFLKGFEAAYPKWISVKEGLPKADEVCIAVNRDGDMMIGHVRKLIDGSCMCDDINSSEWIIKVTHWMQRPKPPKEDT